MDERDFALPGSVGEHNLQREFGNEKRALAFYNNQVLSYLNEEMQRFITEQTMMFIASADGSGECDCSFRAGESGFIKIIDRKRLLWPEYRGNGVTASGGNVKENPHMAILFVDFLVHKIGLHVNGRAFLREDGLFEQLPPAIHHAIERENQRGDGKRPAFWFLVEVEEAYIHCSKHIPRLAPTDGEIAWGTDDEKKKGGDFFRVKAQRKSGATIA